MNIIFHSKLKTYIATDKYGYVLGTYDPKRHGTLEEFREAMKELVSA